ncbi:MAG: DivIVA domain-containing protein [Mycobacteriales bacterium]
MPLTPEDVRTKEFRNTFRGYHEPEVDAFLDEVEGELTRLLRENAELKERLAAAATATAVVAAPLNAPMGETEEMLRRTLLIAQRTADETVAQAKADADRIVADAQAHTQRLLSSAQHQAAAHIGDLEARRQSLEQHIEGLRAFEREYRTRLKAYLEAQLRDLEGRAGPTAPAAPPATYPLASLPPASLPPTSDTSALASSVFTPPPAIPIVDDSPARSSVSQTDIPGGFVRRSERYEDPSGP